MTSSSDFQLTDPDSQAELLPASVRHSITALIAALAETDVIEVELQDGPLQLRLVRDVLDSSMAGTGLVSDPDVTALPAEIDRSHMQSVVQDQPSSSGPRYLRAPLVGVFYRTLELDGPLLMTEGQQIERGQIYGMIEAMNLSNEVDAEESGIVAHFLVADGEPVEYGQPLVELE